MGITRLALLFVVFIDVMGQGLLLPLISAVLLDPSKDFLPKAMVDSGRELRFGIVMGLFYLSWFFGAAFISKLTDYIGRKSGILICLVGTFAGYALTVGALLSSSFLLLVVGRIVAGFTAGNQPIAQAALVDISKDDQEKTRFMGFIVAAAALGLITGPLIVGLLSDKSLLGSFASLELPLFVAALLVLLNITLIQLYFTETLKQRRKIDFGVTEVFLTLWRVVNHPVILRIGLVYFFAILGLNAFFIFLDNFLYARFQFDTLQNSAVMMVLGGTMALSSTFLVGPVAARFRQIQILIMTVIVMAVFVAAYLVNPFADLSYVLVIPILAAFAIAYPTLLTMYSAAVDATEQGWVMGVSIALFTLGSGSVSLIGGWLMAADPRLPFLISIASFAMALVMIAFFWNNDHIRKLDPHSK
jgi:predicted MFS family arabinose efflux permease